MKKNTYYVINNRIFKYCKNAIKYGEKCGYGVLFVFTSKKEAFKRLKENKKIEQETMELFESIFEERYG